MCGKCDTGYYVPYGPPGRTFWTVAVQIRAMYCKNGTHLIFNFLNFFGFTILTFCGPTSAQQGRTIPASRTTELPSHSTCCFLNSAFIADLSTLLCSFPLSLLVFLSLWQVAVLLILADGPKGEQFPEKGNMNCEIMKLCSFCEVQGYHFADLGNILNNVFNINKKISNKLFKM